jgi:hypothetical protein
MCTVIALRTSRVKIEQGLREWKAQMNSKEKELKQNRNKKRSHETEGIGRRTRRVDEKGNSMRYRRVKISQA